MDEPRRGLGRALEAFANAVLERTLPRIRQWLAARLGPRAELASLELDGSRVHLVDARIPLGPRALLHASRITFVTRAEDLALGLPPILLERLEGRVEMHTRTALTAHVTLEGAPARASDEWIAGEIRLRELVIAGRAYEGAAKVWLTSERFGVEDARLEDAGGLRLRVDAGGTFEGGELRTTHARAEADAAPVAAFVEAIAALRGADPPALPIAEGARVSGACELAIGGALRASLRASVGAEERASLEAEGRLEAGALRGEVRGAVAPSVLVLDRVAIGGAPLEYEATLAGTLGAPRVEASARGSALEVRAEGSEPLAVTRVRAKLSLDRALALEVRARAGAGSLAASLEDGVLRLKIERAELAPLVSLVPERAARMAERLALAAGALWLDVRVRGDLIEGALHVEGPRASVTLEPLRASRATRAIEASTLRGRIDPAGLPLAGPVDLELSVEHASAQGIRASGALSSRALSLSLGQREPAALTDVRGRVSIEGREARITEARASAFGGELRGAGTLAFDGEAARVIVTELIASSLREPLARWALSHRREASSSEDAEAARARASAPSAARGSAPSAAPASSPPPASGRGPGGGRPQPGPPPRAGEGALAAAGRPTRSTASEEIERERDEERMRAVELRDLAPGLVVSGALARRGGALRGELEAKTPRSALAMRVVLSDEAELAGSELEGALALPDAAPLFARWSISPGLDAVWQLAGRFEGTLSAPRLELEGRCHRQPVIVRGARSTVELVTEDVRARARATRERVVWRELVARAYGGTLRSRGSASFEGAASARLELDDARAEALPLASGARVGAYLAGALSGTLDLWRARRGVTIGRGRARVVDPEYPVLARAAALAERFGLPLPERRGTEPLSAAVRLGPSGWRFSELSARVPELAVRGAVDVRRDGTLDGRLVASPASSWLERSVLLAAVGGLLAEVPVHLGGSLSAPRLVADAWDAADSALARSALGWPLRALLAEVAPDARARPSRAGGRGHGTASLLTTDELLDRLARDPGDAELFEALLERGLRADEIAAGVAKRR